MQSYSKIGWIGLGQMGVPMVTRLLDNGLDVGIYNRSPEKTQALQEKGATAYPDITALIQNHEVIFLMVSDYTAICDILNEDIRALLPGKIIINMSTISPSENLAVQQLVEAAGGRFAEAPVSGSVAPATNGTLLILFGGDADILAPLQQAFSFLGKKTFHFGGVGKEFHDGLPVGRAIRVLLIALEQRAGKMNRRGGNVLAFRLCSD